MYMRCLISLVLCVLPSTFAELFTAVSGFKGVLRAELDLAFQIRNYVAQEEERLDLLRQIANDYERHSSADADEFLANPLNAFQLVKRFTLDLEPVAELLKNNTSSDFLGEISREYLPAYEDLTGAATAILRLQDTYKLPTNELANGEVPGINVTTTLSVDDCYEIGRQSYNSADYYHTTLWMSHALVMYNQGLPNSIDKAMLLDYLAYAYYQVGNIRGAHDLTEEWLQLDPTNIRAESNMVYYIQLLSEQTPEEADAAANVNHNRAADSWRLSEEFLTYEALCRGEDPMPYKLAHKLTCQYYKPHPYFYLVPLKQEVVFFDPWIVVYHAVLTDQEADRIVELAEPRLARSGTFVYNENDSHHTAYRTSKGAWLHDWEDYQISQVSGKVNKISSLSLDTAEQLQVVNYGIGGHYEPHYDFARPNELSAFDPAGGNRIATAIFYMTDVAAGGATVFPQIGVKLWPGKGNLAFWYNLKKNGEGAYNTRHAGCPVLSGRKWVANKWIHERGQELIYPCSMDPEE